MEFSVLERINLLSILPKEGDITTLRIIRDLRDALSFSEDDHKLLHFQAVGGQTAWDVKGGKAVGLKDVPLGEKALDIIKDVLKKLNEWKKLTLDTLALYERFVENKGVERISSTNGHKKGKVPQKAKVEA